MSKQTFTKDEQDFLLELSRKTLDLYVRENKKLVIDQKEVPDEKLKKEQGCFVTLHENKQLRGCIGHILPVQPLYLDIIENTINAGFLDPRFNPVEESELSSLDLEISILSIPEKLDFTSTEDLLERLKPKIHGVILKKHGHNSTFLPQVWEDLPDKEEFLTHLSLKAGLSPLAWQEDGLEVYTYEAFVFGEND